MLYSIRTNEQDFMPPTIVRKVSEMNEVCTL